MKHHFIPRFLLKQWHNKNGKLIRYYKNERGEIIGDNDLKTASSVGYSTNMYTFNANAFPSIKNIQSFETNFLKALDNKAALIHSKILNEKSFVSLSAHEKIEWANFIHSLIVRIPKAVKTLKEEILKIGSEYLTSLLDIKGTNEFSIKEIGDAFLTGPMFKNESLGLLKRIIKDKNWSDNFCFKMNWKLFVLPEEISFFITSDNPILIKENSNFSLIITSLNPRLLFISYSKSLELEDELIKSIIIKYNLWVIQQSDCFVYSQSILNNDFYFKFKEAMMNSLRPLTDQELKNF
jgi:hypothetical protein